METFFALLALCVGNSLVIGGFPSQRPVMRTDWLLNVIFLIHHLGTTGKEASHPVSHYWHYYSGVSYEVKLLLLIWRSGTRRSHLRIPDLPMSSRDRVQDSNPRNGCQATCLIISQLTHDISGPAGCSSGWASRSSRPSFNRPFIASEKPCMQNTIS